MAFGTESVDLKKNDIGEKADSKSLHTANGIYVD